MPLPSSHRFRVYSPRQGKGSRQQKLAQASLKVDVCMEEEKEVSVHMVLMY